MKEPTEAERKEELKKLQELRKQLALYREERLKSPGLLLSIKDWFRSSSHDPNSVTRRVQVCHHLEHQISQVIALGSKTPSSEEFNAAAIELVQSVCTKIRDNPDRSSRQRIYLSQVLQPLVRILSKVSDQPTRVAIDRVALKHMNFSLADRIVEHQQARLTDIITSPLNWFSRIRDYVYPKERDKRMAELNNIISKLNACEYAEDYRSFLKQTDIMVTQLKKTDSALADLLNKVTLPIRRKLEQNAIPSRKTLTETVPGKAEGHVLDEKMAYFQKKLGYQLTYRLLAHGIGSQTVFQHEPGIWGHIGVTIGNVGSIVPFGKMGGALIGQVLVFAEGQQQAATDACIAEKIPHHVLDKVVMLAAQKLTHRYAAQIALLYHSPLYQKAINKLVDKMVKNIMENLQESPEIILSDKNQLTLYRQLIETRRKQGQLTAEQQHQLDYIHAEILAEHVADGVHKSFTRTPMAGWVTTTHLMHKDDENALFGGSALNLFSVFEKPGRVVVNEDGSLQFYTGVNQLPDKYGYIFTTADEVKKLGLLEDKFPHTDHIKYYSDLHAAYAMKKGVPQNNVSAAVPAQKVSSEISLVQQAQNYATKLREMWQILVTEHKSLTNDQLKSYRKEVQQIKAEIKQNKPLKDVDVNLNAASFPLITFVQSVESRLDQLLKDQLELLQQEHLAIKLTQDLVDQVAVTATPMGVVDQSLAADLRQTVKV